MMYIQKLSFKWLIFVCMTGYCIEAFSLGEVQDKLMREIQDIRLDYDQPKLQSKRYITLLDQRPYLKDRFFILPTAIKSIVRAKNYSIAKTLALELLEIAKPKTSHWNYGNAIHDANLVLGLVALNNAQI